jgi:anti-sigma regulatory factor (Ser/Thr protein kinase)
MTRRALLGEEKPVWSPLLTRVLLGAGVEPVVLRDPSRLCCAARQHPPDLVFLDQRLRWGPEGDRVAAFKLDPATCAVPVVLTPDTGPPGNGVWAEPDDHLPRPFGRADVQGVLARVRRRDARRRRQGVRAELRLHLRSEPRSLEELLQRLQPLLHDSGLPLFHAQQVSLALREVVANAIEWGHQGQAHRPVSVNCRVEADRIALVVRDTGAGFDRRNLPHAARFDDPIAHFAVREARQLREGGFGILMASGLVDELNYNEAGNEVTLVKFTGCAASVIRSQPALSRP